MLYFMPLGTGVSKRKPQSWRHTGWSTPFGDFWCCQGTGVEAFARLAEHIFMERRAGVAPTTALDDVARRRVAQLGALILVVLCVCVCVCVCECVCGCVGACVCVCMPARVED